ncbi:MAG: FtsX-like permease family protein [Rhodothermales bacterium]
MLRNYLTVTLRSMARQKAYTFINVFGLGVGLAAFIMITLFVVNEFAFDAHHPDGDRIFQVQLDAELGEQKVLTASSPAVMAGAFLDAFPELESAVRLDNWGPTLVTYGDNRYNESGFFLADSTLFDFFALPLVKGDPATALNRPNTLVLSETKAATYFGNEDPIGKVVTVDGNATYEITGVFRVPRHNAHLRPDFVASFLSSSRHNDPEWLNNSFYTYLKLRPGVDPVAFGETVRMSVDRFVGQDVERMMGVTMDDAREAGFKYDWVLQSMPELYLQSQAEDQMGRAGDLRYVWLLGVIAGFILLIACINFVNLGTARAAGRAREVGLRKVLGSERGQLVRQFLGESLVTSIFAMVVASVLVVALIPAFNRMADVQLALEPWIGLVMLGAVLVTGLLAGAWPAAVLSSYQPAAVLKGMVTGGRRGALLRSGLVVFQFAISITMLVSTFVVYRQLAFMSEQNLGFNPEQLVVVPVHSQQARQQFEAFRGDLLANPAIRNAAMADILPGQDRIHNTTVFRSENMPQGEFFVAQTGSVSHSYIATMGLEIVAGRSFEEGREADATAWVVNEAAVRRMGWTPEDAIGKRLYRPGAGPDGGDAVGEIIGVVRDVHMESLHKPIMPAVFRTAGYARYMPIRIDSERVSETLAALEERYASFESEYPFAYWFVDEDFRAAYEQEQRLGFIYTTFSILAVVIACLGLFGLASYVTVLRYKEIGIRKVLGASVVSVVRLLSRQFTALVLVACIVSFPISWFMMDRWLSGFAYATSMPWWLFGVAGLMALGIAWLTVAGQSVKAALLDPVKAIQRS